jgi:hypothetical protein
MALTQPPIFTFSKGGGSKGIKSMKELVGFAVLCTTQLRRKSCCLCFGRVVDKDNNMMMLGSKE